MKNWISLCMIYIEILQQGEDWRESMNVEPYCIPICIIKIQNEMVKFISFSLVIILYYILNGVNFKYKKYIQNMCTSERAYLDWKFLLTGQLVLWLNVIVLYIAINVCLLNIYKYLNLTTVKTFPCKNRKLITKYLTNMIYMYILYS